MLNKCCSMVNDLEGFPYNIHMRSNCAEFREMICSRIVKGILTMCQEDKENCERIQSEYGVEYKVNME